MKKKLLIVLGIFGIPAFVFFLIFKPVKVDSKIDSISSKSQEVVVSEFSSPGLLKTSEYNLGELKIELQNEKNCNFKTSISLLYEKEKKDALGILTTKESNLKEFVKLFLSKQSSEKIKTFHQNQDLEIELVNQINKFLNQNLVLVVLGDKIIF